MKFTNSFKLTLAIALIYLTTFTKLEQIRSSINSSLSAQKGKLANKSYTSSSNKTQKTLSLRKLLRTNLKSKQVIKKGCAMIYKDCGFKGASLLVCKDIREYSSDWEDSVSSVRIGPNTKMVIFKKANLNGKAIEITQDKSCLATEGFNDEARSHVFLDDYSALIFSDCNYDGFAFKIDPEEDDLRYTSISGSVSSVILGIGAKISLYAKPKFQGEKRTLKQNIPCLGDFNDKAASVRCE